MSSEYGTLTMKVRVLTQDRGDHWCAKVANCPIAVYADSEKAAQQRAIEALKLLLQRQTDQEAYLYNKRIPYWEESESMHQVAISRGA